MDRSIEREVTRYASSEVDTDCDGIPDEVEDKYGLDPKDPDDAERDPDNDEIPSIVEIRLGGDPTVPDTDGDGVEDGDDLVDGRDLDQDGVPAPADNCPQDVNPSQSDLDGDGRGDACDDAPRIAIAEALDRLASDHALLPLGGGNTSRLAEDRAEVLPMPSSFRIFGESSTAFATVPLYELYHVKRRDHAYVTSARDKQQLVAGGYEDLGILGHLTVKPLAFGGAVEVRRFTHPTSREEAVTVDAETAQRLAAAGFAERTPLGWAVIDEGKLRKPRDVMRYRQDVYRHQATPLVTAGYDSDGTRFRVLREKIGGALPLFRLRDDNQREYLSTDPAEVAQFEHKKIWNDGLIGWAVGDPEALPTQKTVELWRLELGDRHRYSANAAEIEAWKLEGWLATQKLGWVVEHVERIATCAGPSPVKRLEDKLVAMAARPEERAVATLTAIVASCAMQRVLDGHTPGNAAEAAIATRLPKDPELRRRLREHAKRWQDIDPTIRAQSLDRYQYLDPGACTGPIDLDTLRDQVHDEYFLFTGPPPSLREPFCDGTLYAATDPAAGTERETRAVTVDAIGTGEFEFPAHGRPRLFGVLDTEFVRGHPAAQAFATANPNKGFSTAGVDTGLSCSPVSPCAAGQGLRCMSGRCIAYPIVRNSQNYQFTGENFWDVIDGEVRFRDTITGEVTREPDEITSSEPESDQRCLPDTSTNKAMLERPLPLIAGRFYEVEVVNKNGLFYEHAETIPFDEATARERGRTLHVCYSPNDTSRPPDTITDCTSLNSTTAACPVDGPPCGPTTGGVWGGATGQRPRSLQFCTDNNLQCGETPREFTSRDAAEPHFIFVEQSPPTKTITTNLQGVTCHNETGRDWLGSDELGVIAVGAVGAPATTDEPELEVDGNAWTHDYDSDDRSRQINARLIDIPVIESVEGADIFMGGGNYFMALMEDDSAIWGAVIGILVVTITALVIVLVWPATGPAVGLIAAALIASWTLYMVEHGEDDLLGKTSWFATPYDVTDRGTASHDLNYATVPQLPRVPETVADDEFVGAYQVSVHPAVDNFERARNSSVSGVECLAATDCTGGKVCQIGLCVRSDWRDLEPPIGSGAPGFLERREFVNGSEWRYDIYLGWNVR